ncbi:MAG: hypothetical protein WA946_08685, partial [Nitrospirota bacterium]
MPSPYTVSLVGPSGATKNKGAAVEPGTPSPVEKKQTMPHIDEKKELKSIEESIAALKAKRQKEKQIEKILSLRRTLVSIQGRPGKPTAKSSAQNKVMGSGGGSNAAGYT